MESHTHRISKPNKNQIANSSYGFVINLDQKSKQWARIPLGQHASNEVSTLKEQEGL